MKVDMVVMRHPNPGAGVFLSQHVSLIEDFLDGRYDFNAQFERGLEAILHGWS